MNEYGIYISAATLLAIIGAVVKVMRYVAAVEKDVREHVNAETENVSRDVSKLGIEIVKRSESLQRETGEVGAALRAKIHELEVFTRDHFVSKQSFEAFAGRIEKSVDNLGDKIERRFDKIDERIEKMTD